MDTDAGVDGRWLTYAELAELRRIDKPSAVKLVIRRHWQTRKNNRGAMQVYVPAEISRAALVALWLREKLDQEAA
jgi:hypothetical protein